MINIPHQNNGLINDLLPWIVVSLLAPRKYDFLSATKTVQHAPIQSINPSIQSKNSITNVEQTNGTIEVLNTHLADCIPFHILEFLETKVNTLRSINVMYAIYCTVTIQLLLQYNILYTTITYVCENTIEYQHNNCDNTIFAPLVGFRLFRQKTCVFLPPHYLCLSAKKMVEWNGNHVVQDNVHKYCTVV